MLGGLGRYYTPNPKRAIHIEGEIDHVMVDRLDPQIHSLQCVSREPITVFIDSPGGSVSCAEDLKALLFAEYDDGGRCRILTVAEGFVASAATDLLCSGDYALALQDSVIHFHGTRLPLDDDLSFADATNFAHDLDVEDSRHTRRLIEAREDRFLFRCRTLEPELDLTKYLEAIKQHLSPRGLDVTFHAYPAMLEYRELIVDLDIHPDREVRLLNALIGQTFTAGRVPRHLLIKMIERFLIAQFYLQMTDTLPDRRGFQHWLDSFHARTSDLTRQEQIAALNVGLQRLHEFSLFFVALCRRLQQDENPLSATDAFHLGLIDEVIGLTGFLTTSLLVEYPCDLQ